MEYKSYAIFIINATKLKTSENGTKLYSKIKYGNFLFSWNPGETKSDHRKVAKYFLHLHFLKMMVYVLKSKPAAENLRKLPDKSLFKK